MKLNVVLGVVLAATLMVAGEEFTWTGAVDGYWTNAANWQVGTEVAARCPGIVSNDIWNVDGTYVEDWSNTVHKTDLAVFTTVAQGAATTINLEGHYCVSSVVFRAGCDRFTLGAASNQVFALQAFGGSWDRAGVFKVESGAKAPTLVAGFSCGAIHKSLLWTGSSNGYVSILNDSDDELVFGTFGHSRQFANYSNVCHVYDEFGGTGNFRFAGPVRGVRYYTSSGLYQCMHFVFSATGKVVFSTPQFGRGRTNRTRDAAENHGLYSVTFTGSSSGIEILEGCRVSISDWNYPTLSSECNAEIRGAGTFQHCVQGSKGINGNFSQIWVANNKTLKVSSIFDVYDSSYADNSRVALKFCGNYSSGTFFICGPTNMFVGDVWFYTDPVSYRANSVANFGGGSNVYFRVSGMMEYAGAGNETLTRNFWIATKGKSAQLRNSGTGTLEFNGQVAVTNNATFSGDVVFSAYSAPIVFSGKILAAADYKLTLYKEGESSLILDPAADLSGCSELRLKDGTLDLTQYATSGDVTFPVPIHFQLNNTTLLVPDGVTITLPELARTSGETTGALNILCNTGRIKIAGATETTALPDGVTINGTAAAFDAEGRLVVLPPAYDTAIAAKGDTVPNDATKAVAIMTAGTGENDTLAADDTSVKELFHYASVDTTLAIGEGRTFTAGLLELCGLAGNFTIGTADDAGTVAGADGVLKLLNYNANSQLRLNAALAENTEVCVDTAGDGELKLAGGSTGEIAIDQRYGQLTLTGEDVFQINGGAIGVHSNVETSAELVLDGAKVVLGTEPLHVGARKARVSDEKSVATLVITNSTVVNAAISKTYAGYSTNDAICVGLEGNAKLEIREGAVITNRLIVGGIYNGGNGGIAGSNLSQGRVIQTGGEMVVLGSTSDATGSFIGGSCGNGYYELRGGKLVWMGCLCVGCFSSGSGSFAQFGGVSIFTNAFGSTSKSTIGPNSAANGGAAVMRFAGGKAEIRAKVVLAGGATNKSLSLMTVENDAEVDAADNTIQLCGSHNIKEDGIENHNRQADLVLMDGYLRAAGFFCGYNSAAPFYRQRYTVGFAGGEFITGAKDKDIAYGATSSAQAATNFVVYAGGAVINTEGKTGNRSSAAFRRPWGKGVKSIPLAKSSYTGFIASPYVMIDGDGVGATAVAEFDSTTGTLTGVRVLTAGCGYTWAKAYVYINTAWNGLLGTTQTPIACELTDNTDFTGGFTKKGAGDFTLNATNTWGGATRLEGGVLRLGVAQALPENSTVVYAGGTLESTAAATPAAFTAEIAPELVAARKSVKLLTYTDAAPAVWPEVTLTGIPAAETGRWMLDRSGTALYARAIRGMKIFLR